MAAVHPTQTSSCHKSLIKRASPECSIIVDDVDEGRLRAESNTPSTDDAIESVSPNSEYTLNRIKEFQRVAEGRKLEFARLLEEHAQVIRRLKQIEEPETVSIPTTNSA